MQTTGRLSRIIFHSEANGYTVGVVTSDDGSFRIAGNMAEPKEGTTYTFEGRFVIHQKYGEQFAFGDYEEQMPEGADAILDFLSSGSIRGIGPKTAELIVARWGDDSMTIIDEQPDKLLEIKGIGKTTLEKITASYAESRDFAKISLELRELGISMSEAVRIFKLYGSESAKIVRENPYTLVDDIRGINFVKADEIAGRIGFEPDSHFRVESGIKYTLKTWALSGSTLMPRSLLTERVIELLDTTTEAIDDVLQDLIFTGEIQTDTFGGGEEAIYLYGYYHAEQRVAYNLKRIETAQTEVPPIMIEDAIADAESRLTGPWGPVELSDEQRKAVREALLGNVTIITGGPGTGKTTIINTIVRVFERLGIDVALAAPTGRAAKRMQEAAGIPAMTIHRLLEYVYSEDEDELYFGRNEENPLEQKVIIVDEASMIDIMLMDGLLRAIQSGSRLIITGDADQLPSVGAGNVLRDIIASDYINTIRLKDIFRQAAGSLIVTNAHLINSGEYPETGLREYDSEGEPLSAANNSSAQSRDFFIMNAASEEDIADTIKSLVGGRLQNYYDFITEPGDIQVLSPTKKGVLGVPNLNSLLQEVVNPAGEAAADAARYGNATTFGAASDDTFGEPPFDMDTDPAVGHEASAFGQAAPHRKSELKHGNRIFREGDKVMQIRNNYQAEWRASGDFETHTGIFNGDMGTIESIDEPGKRIIVRSDDRIITYEGEMLDELELAYAITVHKSQGCEFPAVIIPIWQFPPMLMTRNLLYTAVTRGKQLVILIGNQRYLKWMIDNNRIDERYTGLKDRLEEGL